MAFEINYRETRGPNVDAFLDSQPTPFCFIPICLYSFMANRPFLREYIPWVVSRCEQPRIIIGDYMERHNIMVFESLTETEAINKVEKRGQKIVKDIEPLLISHEMNSGVHLLSCREIIETSECKEIITTIQDFESSNENFKEDVDQQIALMLANTKRLSLKRIEDINEVKMALFRVYMFEEIAFFISLYNKGFATEIYPGRDMNILKKMAASRYRGFPYDFSERTHISISVSLDSGTSYALLDNIGSEGD